MHVNSPSITKNLGACSPRETHMKEPTSTHKLPSYVLLVGMPICPNAGKQDHASLKTTPRRKRLSRELTPSSRRKRLSREQTPPPRQKTPREAKSKHLVNFPLAGFCPSSLSFSLLYLMGCLRVKGDPQASRLAGSYFSRPHTPPGLVEP